MANPELAELLNLEFGLGGRDAVTANVIRQWVTWGVLPKAKATASAIGNSPEWSRDDRSHRRARRLAELRKAGVRRETAVIAQAYFEWGHGDFDRARGAILSEYRRGRAKILKPLTTDMRFADYGAVRSVAKLAIKNQSGPLDNRFRGTQFQQSPELIALTLQLATRGDSDLTRITELMGNSIGQMVPAISPHIGSGHLSTIANSMTGVFGSADEIGNSAESTIERSSLRQFRIARYLTGRGLRAIRFADGARELSGIGAPGRELMEMLALLGPQISIGQWALFIFVQALQGIAQNDKLPLELRVNCPI